MATKLDKTLKRELDINGEAWMLSIMPEGLKLVPKGKRNTCRRCSPSKVQAAANLMRPASKFRSTSSRTNSLSLIETTANDVHFQLHLRCSPTFTPVEHDARFRAMLVIPRPAPGSHC